MPDSERDPLATAESLLAELDSQLKNRQPVDVAVAYLQASYSRAIAHTLNSVVQELQKMNERAERAATQIEGPTYEPPGFEGTAEALDGLTIRPKAVDDH